MKIKQKLNVTRINGAFIRKFLLFTNLIFFISTSVYSQNASCYEFTATSGTYSNITGTTATLSGGSTDEGYYNSIPIGFTFNYGGTNYTTVSASTNGWLTFGQNISNAALTNNLSSGGTRPLVAPLWDDLDMASGTVTYTTSGVSPNRIFTIQWDNVEWNYSATSAVIDFQVKLYESTNIVDFVYNQEATGVNSGSASIGITCSSTGSGAYLSLNNSGTSPTASKTSETTSINTKPANGQTYRFSPPASNASTLTAGSGTEPTSISSLINTQAASILNFDFTYNDAANSNNSQISQIVIYQGTGNDITNWTEGILGAVLTDGTNTKTGTINSNNITFSAISNSLSTDLGYIADNGNKTYTLKIWLKTTMGGTLAETIDGTNFVFEVNNSSFNFANCEGLANGQSVNSGASNNVVSVIATKLSFTTQPSSQVNINTNLAQAPIIKAQDANNNIDLDVNGTITINNSGSISMNNYTLTATSGVATFTNLQFTSTGSVNLSATCSSPIISTSSSSNAINICGPISSFPLTQNFDGVTAPAIPGCWAIDNSNSDAETWKTYAGSYSTSPNCLRINYTTSVMNDWFFSPELQLTGGTTYKVKFKYKGYSSSYSEKLEVKWGSSQSVAGMTSPAIFSNTNITNTTYTEATATFTPPVNGSYYIGWHGFSIANQYYIYLDDIEINVYGPPTITSLSSNTFYTDKGKQITINGTNLSSTTSVTLGGITGTINSNIDEQIVVTFPAGNYSNNTLTVTTAAGSVNSTITVNTRNIIPVNSASDANSDDHLTINSALNGLWAWKNTTSFTSPITISVYAGTYNEGVDFDHDLNPTSTNRLIIQANTTTPTINASGNNYGLYLHNGTNAIDYVTIKNLTITNASINGIKLQGQGLLIENNIISNSIGDNININGGGNNNEIRYNKTYNSTSGAGIAIQSSQNANIHHNLSYDNSTYGINIFGSTPDNAIIKNNTCYNNGNATGSTTNIATQGFNALTLPAGWTSETITDSDADASITGVTTGSYPTVSSPDEGTHFIKFNSFNCDNNDVVRLKQTASISTIGFSNITVNFAWFEQSTSSSYTNEGVTVQWSTNGTTWTDATFYRSYNSVSGWKNKSCVLPVGADNLANLYIAFKFTSGYGYNCYLDDVVISGLSSITYVGAGLNIQTGSGSIVTNNIFFAKSSSGDNYYAMSTATGITISNSSGYNTYYANGNTYFINHNGTKYNNIATWNGTTEGNNDLNSDPLFVTNGTDFHLKSIASQGSYHNGNWPPTNTLGGTWTTDTGNSPSIDAGNPTDTYSNEITNNGSRINQGVYGNTPQASKTASAMAYVSSNTTQNSLKVIPSATNQNIIGIEIVTSGELTPLIVNSINFNTNGTSSVADISNAKLYYTGTSSTFAAVNQVGSTVVAPSGAFTVSPSTTLSSGTNYFWLTYDINTTAVIGNIVDAECNTITINTISQTPTISSPTGNRLITGPIANFPYYEGFEESYPDWIQDASDNFDWTQNSNTTPSSPTTGPYGAKDGSKYLYTEANGYNSQTANIYATFDFTTIANPVLYFYYHMYGSNMGTLFVDVSDNGGAWTSVSTLSGQSQTSCNTAWNQAKVDLSAYGGATHSNVRIRFRGATGAGNNSDIAIDKVEIPLPSCNLFTETFESQTIGGLPTSGTSWKRLEITPSANIWAIGDNTSSISGNKSLTISNGSPYTYTITDDASTIAYYGTLIDATKYSNLKLSFKWKCAGQSSNDYGTVVWSTDAINWQTVNNTVYQGQSTTQSVEDMDLSILNNKQFYIGFKWVNNATTGTNPPFTIDDIYLNASPDMNYAFSYRQDAYTPVENGTTISLDADFAANITLPFTFNYADNNYTTARISRNGWIKMGTSNPGQASNNNLGNNNYSPFIAPLWDNLSSDEFSTIQYLTSGASPNRVTTIEWRNVLWNNARQNFQVKLFETTNVIEFIYGVMSNVSSGDATIGINDASGFCASRFISVTPGSTPTISLTSSNNNISSNTNLTEGLVYVFNPQAMQTYQSWQAASIVVGQADFVTASNTTSQTISSGANSSSVSSKGVLAVGSGYSNRVMIWNTVPTSNGLPADIVIGQTNFTSSSSGTTSSTLDNPSNVAFTPDGTKLLVADAGNNRVLIWNTIPTSNGTAANVVIGQDNFTSSTSGCSSTKLSYPTGILVLPDGRLIITDNDNNRVLIYNSIPTTNGAAADIVIGQKDFVSSSTGSDADELDNPWDAAFTPDGKLLISDNGSTSGGNHRILIFNKVPTSNGASADYVMGNDVFGSIAASTSRTNFNQPSVTVSCEGKIAVADFGNSRIMLYNRVPNYNGAPADAVLGQPDFTQDVDFNNGSNVSGSPSNKNMYYPYSICFDLNGRLFVNGTHPSTGNGMHRVMIFGEAPTETADLSLSISSDAAGTMCIGSDVTYSVTITNNGPVVADHVVINAALPVGFTLVNSNTSTGSFNSLSGYWTVPAIPVDSTYTLTFTGTITSSLSSKSVIAYANIVASKQNDNNFTNNADNEIIGVGNNNNPTISEIADVCIQRNSTTGAISFTISDIETSESSLSLYAYSSNTTIVDVSDIVFGGSGAIRTVTVTPKENQIGTVEITIEVNDGTCSKYEKFVLTCGNVWNGIISSNWHLKDNWSFDVPSSTVEAIIPEHPRGPYFPIVGDGNAECYHLEIANNSFLTINNGIDYFDLYGNLINYGNFTCNDVTVRLLGDQTQIINSTNTEINNLYVNNSNPDTADIVLGNNLTVYGVLTLENGIINTVNNKMIFTSTTNIESSPSPSNNSYIDGTIRRTGTRSFEYPLGGGGYWAPITLESTIDISTFDVQYINSGCENNSTTCMNALHHVSYNEHWEIDRIAGTEYPGVTLHWKDGSRSGIIDLTDLRIAHWNETSHKWEDMGGTTSGDENSGSITSTVSFTSYSPIAFGSKTSPNPLVVELTEYTINCINEKSEIKWATNSETNNDFFTIEKSMDGSLFKKISILKGQGNSNILKQYQFIDEETNDKTVYYRLSQTDFDGKTTYFSVLASKCNSSTNEVNIIAHPSPFNGDINFTIYNPEKEFTLNITDAMGKTIKSESFTNIENSIFTIQEDLSNISNGLYYYHYISKTKSIKNKILKQN